MFDSHTTWKNPTQHTIRVKLFATPTDWPRDRAGNVLRDHHGEPVEPPQRCLNVEWKPGEERQVPSMYDDALRVMRSGVVVGGHAPQLVKLGEPPVPIHSDLLALPPQAKEDAQAKEITELKRQLADLTAMISLSVAGADATDGESKSAEKRARIANKVA